MKNKNTMNVFFNPQGIALIGARRSPGFGFGIPMQLKEKGWGDRLYLVNPKGGQLHGMPVYKSIADVPDPVDLAVIIIPAPFVPDALVETGMRGIRHVIIESAGFAETDDKGRALQGKVRQILEKYHIRAIGPNCVGVVNTENKFCTTETLEDAFTPGNTAIIAQSGVFGNILLDRLYLKKFFVSKVVTLGNRVDVSEIDILEYLNDDPLTSVIMMYLEGAADGRELKKTLGRVVPNKPVLILKSGRTAQGVAATSSHTGSLSGEDKLYQGLFAQTNVIRVDSLEELVDFGRVFATQPLPAGPRLGIVTGSGSMGALATDAAVIKGLEMPLPSYVTVEKVKKVAPEWMNVKNPLDVGPSGIFNEALAAMLEDPVIDMVMAILAIPHSVFRMFQSMGVDVTQYFGDISKIRKVAPDKPLVLCVVGHDEFYDYIAGMAGIHVPVLNSPETAASALAALWRYKRNK